MFPKGLFSFSFFFLAAEGWLRIQPGARFCGAPDGEPRASFMKRYRAALTPAKSTSRALEGARARSAAEAGSGGFALRGEARAWLGGGWATGTFRKEPSMFMKQFDPLTDQIYQLM